MAGPRRLTELEGGVLGYFKAMGPCTPYAIRKEFLASTTPYWSGSAGAIYPLVRRLAERGLVRPVRPTGDRRGGTLYALTAAGERALVQWLGPPLSVLTVGAPPDPIRTRVGFMELMSPEGRLAFLAEAEAGLLGQMAAAEPAPADPFERWAWRGRRLMMEARLAWVREMAEGLARSSSPESGRGRGSGP
jgi:DNA-binding PadR family transcriptional regulator